MSSAQAKRYSAVRYGQPVPASAGNEIQRRALELVEAGRFSSISEAQNHVLNFDPELRQRYHQETLRTGKRK
jgi:hypothetical protein